MYSSNSTFFLAIASLIFGFIGGRASGSWREKSARDASFYHGYQRGKTVGKHVASSSNGVAE